MFMRSKLGIMLAMSLLMSLLSSSISYAVVAEIVTVPLSSATASGAEEDKVDLLSRGLLDFGVSDGQVQASAQVVRLRIGEPNGFSVPLYLLSGATSGEFGDPKLNKAMIFDLISQTGGIANVLANGTYTVWKTQKVTQVKIGGAISGKAITGRNATTGDSKTTAAFYGEAGARFQTGAWGQHDTYTDGVFWLEGAFVLTAVSGLQDYVGTSTDSPSGFRLDLGIYIKDKVNIKAGMFVTTTGDDLPTLDNNQFRLALDYNVSKN